MIEIPNSCPGGGPSAGLSGPQPAYHLGSILSLMGRRNGLIRIWRPPYGVWQPEIPHLGPLISFGLNMPTPPSTLLGHRIVPFRMPVRIHPSTISWGRGTSWCSLCTALCPTLLADLEEG